MGRPTDIALTPDGAHLYAASGSLVPFAVDAASGQLAPRPAIAREEADALRVAVAPDGGRVYAGRDEYRTFDRDAATGALTPRSWSQLGGTLPCTVCMPTTELITSPDGAMVLDTRAPDDRLFQAAPTADGVAAVRSYANGTDGMRGLGDGTGLAWSPDGRFLLTAGAVDGARGAVTTLRRSGDALEFADTVSPQAPWIADPRERPPGISIEDGAIYTNDPEVEVRVALPDWIPSSFELANSRDFAAARLMRVEGLSARYRWRLDTSGGPSRTVKHVFVRFLGGGQTLDDDIILDTLAPQIVSARLRGRTLHVAARDNRSGVRRVQVTGRRSRPGRLRRFRRRLRVAPGVDRAFVRVVDGAGNRSRWRRARR
jgi:hypothetical protein